APSWVFVSAALVWALAGDTALGAAATVGAGGGAEGGGASAEAAPVWAALPGPRKRSIRTTATSTAVMARTKMPTRLGVTALGDAGDAKLWPAGVSVFDEEGSGVGPPNAGMGMGVGPPNSGIGVGPA